MKSATSSAKKVVLITGAASGLGWELAQAYWRSGAALVLADVDAALLSQRQAQLSNEERLLIAHLDVTDHDALTQLVEQISARFGRLDVLINNAGITQRSLAAKTDPAVFRKVMAVDWQGPLELALLCLPLLRQSQGSLVNIGSMAGWMPVLGRAGYCAAKAALAQSFEVMRCELAQDNIHVLMVYPAFLDTPIEKNALGADGRPANHARTMTGPLRSARWMAQAIVDAERKRKSRLFPDRLSSFGSILWRLWPDLYLKLMSRRFASELNQ
jgi:NAD(P)-dependent dehydrogenase (short-subunit alcohol dehydrogenase family)